MVERQHDGASGLPVENARHAVLDSPIRAVEPFQIERVGVCGGVETKIVSVSDVVQVSHSIENRVFVEVGTLLEIDSMVNIRLSRD